MRKRLPYINGTSWDASCRRGDPIRKDTLNFTSKERGKLLFLKNGNNPDELLSVWRKSLSETQFLMMMDLAGELATQLHTDLGNDIDALVCGYFRNKGLDVDALTNLRLFFVGQLDDYYRRLKSTLITESLLDFPIEVHGFNWDHVNFSNKRAKLIPTADYNVSRAMMKDALGVIDMSPNTGITPHDRCRRAFGSYTLCLTNEQECFKRQFAQYRDFCFKFDKESLQAKVADVLAHPKRYVELGIEIADDLPQGGGSQRYRAMHAGCRECGSIGPRLALPGPPELFWLAASKALSPSNGEHRACKSSDLARGSGTRYASDRALHVDVARGANSRDRSIGILR